MKNYYLVTLKLNRLDENGFDCHKFFKTKQKFKSARDVRNWLTSGPYALFDDDIADLTPCSKDWGK